jgi:three-Cys-motif partner protein
MRDTVWEAEPHTLAKQQILRKYLGGWLPTLALGGNRRIVFIDGFCGPGEYSAGEAGSPVVALRAYLEHPMRPRMDGEFVFVFGDNDAARIAHLRDRVLPRLGSLPANVRVHFVDEEFATTITSILDGLGDKHLAPCFAFVDPFGFSHTPMSLIHRILENPRSEVLVTVMLENVNRFATNPVPAVAAHFDALFGDPGWRDLLSGHCCVGRSSGTLMAVRPAAIR